MHFKYLGPDDEVFTEVYANRFTKRIRIINYTDDMIDRAFGVKENITWDDLIEFFESRTLPRGRQDIDLILKELNLKEYDPIKLCRILGGKMANDGCRIQFLP